MTTSEMISVMQAYERGEQIEYRIKDFMRDDEWYVQKSIPEWDWRTYDYRVKPKPTYRPYKNAAEFLAAQKEHGMNIRQKRCNYYRLPLYITDTFISIQYPQIDGSVVSVDKLYGDLLREYTWQDGTPCGIEELLER